MKQKIFTTVTILFSVMFINAGLNKFFNYMPMPDNLPEKMMKAIAAFNEIGWIMPLVGAAEVVGGILILIPKTRAIGALIILPIMVGIFFTNTIQDSSGLPIAFIFGAILGWIMYENRKKYALLIN